MGNYEIHEYRGNYRWRQKQANLDGCAAYVEHHFNASPNQTANYTLVITGYHASETSKSWGKTYAKLVSQAFGTELGGVDGVLVGGFNGKGTGSLKYTAMPAILLEPLFVSNPEQAELVKSEEGQDKLAQCLVDSIRTTFPKGGKIGFSVGHKYKSSSPNDRGAAVYGGGTEADYAEIVLKKAKFMLENKSPDELQDELLDDLHRHICQDKNMDKLLEIEFLIREHMKALDVFFDERERILLLK